MSPKTRAKMGSRGVSSVFTAVVMALTIAVVIAAIAVSWPMMKSNFDKSSWSGSMGLYKIGFTYTKSGAYAYAQNNVVAELNDTPGFVGYCIAYKYNATTAIYSCPSNQPDYQR
jgi:opacity protein-like surface antigen